MTDEVWYFLSDTASAKICTLSLHDAVPISFHAAGDPERYRGHGEPWQPLKLYYNHGFSLVRMRAVHEALVARGEESPFGEWIESREAREIPERRTTTSIECAAYFPQRDDALRARDADRPERV